MTVEGRSMETFRRRAATVLGTAMILLLPCTPSAAQTVVLDETGIEFCGPFPSWKDVKADYGAKGDGIADDAPAIGAALEGLRDMPENAWSTLYFPAGTYRIRSTIRTERRRHQDWLGCQIIGEDPASTVIAWDGEEGKWMWGLDAWYCKVSRLTFDGRRKAGAGLVRWNSFQALSPDGAGGVMPPMSRDLDGWARRRVAAFLGAAFLSSIGIATAGTVEGLFPQDR